MAEYFTGLGYKAKAVGISEYHTKQAGTDWCHHKNILWADMAVCVSTVHEAFIRGLMRGQWPDRDSKRMIQVRVVPLEGAEPHSPIVAVPDFREWVLSVMRESFPVSQEKR